MIYDIIGDIHGCAKKLEGLLEKLKYKMTDGIYQQNGHKAIFVGDLIDRGNQNRRVLEIIRPMVDHHHALAVMGNHEFNAICYHTQKSATDWLRPHTRSNFTQHENFLKEYPLNHPETKEVIEWFKSLPIYLDLGDLRIIHACWDQKSIDEAHSKYYFNPDGTLNEYHLVDSARKDTPLFEIIERLLKGPELSFPDNVEAFLDKDGTEHREIRVQWWGNITPGSTYKNLAFFYDPEDYNIPDVPADDAQIIPKFDFQKVDTPYGIPLYSNPTPVFFGHYWLTCDPKKQQSNVCCIDYSAGQKGPLVSYQFDTEKNDSGLSNANFLSFPGDNCI